MELNKNVKVVKKWCFAWDVLVHTKCVGQRHLNSIENAKLDI